MSLRPTVTLAADGDAAALLGTLAERLLPHLGSITEAMLETIFDVVPEMRDDPLLAEGTRASCASNIERWVTATAQRPTEPVGIGAPPQALDLARDFVRRGMQHDALLTAYRQGQNVLWRAILAEARGAGLSAEELVAVLDLASTSLFAYVDATLAAIGELTERERLDLVGGALAKRRETVLLLLDGAPISSPRASARLGYELERPHLALILWSIHAEADIADLERQAGAMAEHLGAARPLSLPIGVSTLWAWCSGVTPDERRLRDCLAGLASGIAAATGTVRRGMTGFRESHLEAREAQRLLLDGPAAPDSATYAEVAVVSLASHDRARARAFVRTTLGALAGADPQLRDTVRAYLTHDANAAQAARDLHTHRNTVLKRLAKAESLLDAPLAGRTLEVRLALELQRWIGE